LSNGKASAQAAHGVGATKDPNARVFIVEDPDATFDLVPDPVKIHGMVDRTILELTGKPTVSQAWKTLVATNDVVGIKVFSTPGPNSGTRREVVAAIVQDLLGAGLPATNIVVWDRRLVELRIAGYYELERRFGIRIAGSSDVGYDPKVFYDTPLLGNLIYSDLEFGQTGKGIGRKSYVSKLLTQQITKIINVTPLLHHNIMGVSGNLFSLAMGSVDNIARFEISGDDMAQAVPEIYALPALGDRVVLNVVDALICQYEGQAHGLLHYSTVLNQLRFSKDPVALDVLSLQEINRQRELAGVPVNQTNVDLYSNASLLEIGVSDPHHIQVVKVP
jgi:hypothetical protein